jgi:CheY-like chemotaxis protein
MPEGLRPGDEADLEERPLRVLVIDDHELNRRVMQAVLAEFNCSVTLAASGEEAASHVATQAFELIVADFHMPDQDGDATVRQIRGHGQSQEAYVARWSTDRSGRLDGSLYDAELPKPINCAALADVVADARRRLINRADADAKVHRLGGERRSPLRP